MQIPILSTSLKTSKILLAKEQYFIKRILENHYLIFFKKEDIDTCIHLSCKNKYS